MLKIIHVANFNYSKKSGIAEAVLNLKKYQEKLGCEVFLLNFRKQEIVEETIKNNEYIIPKFKDFKKRVSEINPDVIIFHSIWRLQFFRFYRHIKGKYAYLIEPHGGMNKENLKKGRYKKKIVNYLFINDFIKSANGIIFLNNNERLMNYYADFSPQSTIIPNGIDSLNKTNKENGRIITLGYLGRIDIQGKGINILLDAIELLSQNKEISKLFKLKIWGFGNDNDIKYLNKRINSTSLKDLVSYEGAVFGKAKEIALSLIDIFILTSRYEGMPMGILEALSFGCPCILTPTTNMTNIINDYNCGWVTNLDYNNIAETIQIAITDYMSNEFLYRENAWMAARSFLWEDIAVKSIKSYTKLINS